MPKNAKKKQCHDENGKKKKFRVGDLVLLYTPKKHKRKLKKCGLGPYVISKINTSSAICLETLYGQQMVNFVNGSCLKKYEEPLTREMLQQLRMEKTKKEGL